MGETKLSEMKAEDLEQKAGYFARKKKAVLATAGALAIGLTLGSHYYLQYSKPALFAKGHELRQEIRTIEHARRPDVPFGVPKQLDVALEEKLVEAKSEYAKIKAMPDYAEDLETAHENLDLVSKINLSGLGLIGLLGFSGAFYYHRKKAPFAAEIDYRERRELEDKRIKAQLAMWNIRRPEPKRPWWEPHKVKGKYDVEEY